MKHEAIKHHGRKAGAVQSITTFGLRSIEAHSLHRKSALCVPLAKLPSREEWQLNQKAKGLEPKD